MYLQALYKLACICAGHHKQLETVLSGYFDVVLVIVFVLLSCLFCKNINKHMGWNNIPADTQLIAL